jgi:hypothetical protein
LILINLKKKKLLSGNVKFKEQKWIPFSKAMQDALSIPGIAMGHINIVRGGSNTGKTTTVYRDCSICSKNGCVACFNDYRNETQLGTLENDGI